MEIDIEKAKHAFNEYVKKYNPDDEKIKLKISHIEMVSHIAKEIAMELNLDKEDVELAELIGLLHDIGRFEQIRIYHTFIDNKSVNHGEYGAKILFEDNLIRNFIDTDRFDEIIRLAIINHNRTNIQSNLTDKQKLHIQLIRDADKADIFSILVNDNPINTIEKSDISNDKISDEIYREFIEDKKINYKERKTSADILVSHFCYVYDLNFAQTKKIIRENEYIDKLYRKFKFNDKITIDRFNQIYVLSKQHIQD